MSLLPFLPFISDMMQTGQNNQNINRQNTANMQMQELQWRRSLDMWNRQNEYNSPKAQMARLKEAGLNPNLVYGNGSVVGNTTGQLPRYEAPQLSFDHRLPNFSTNLSEYQDLQVKNAQIDNLKKQGQLFDEQIWSRYLDNFYNDESMADRLMTAYHRKVNAGLFGSNLQKEGFKREQDLLLGWRTLAAKSEIPSAELANIRERTRMAAAENSYRRELLDSQLLRSQVAYQSAMLERDMKAVDKKWQRAEKWQNVIKTFK